MQISARNKLPGKIKKITAGPINAEVVIAFPGGTQIVSVITKASAKSLGLKKGMDVRAVIKSSDVMIGVCCGHDGCKCGT
jgi:molybdopterin-binding protein